MLVFSKARLVFLSVPKTGTTAYESALAPLADIHVSNPPELKHAPVYRYNRFFRPMLDKFVGENLEVLAVVREPVSWLGSWYRFRQRPFMQGKPNSTEGISFDAFVEAYTQGKRPGFANVGSQAKFLEPAGNGTAATTLFRYEDQDGLRAFLEARLETRIETARENVSPGMQLSLSPEVERKLRRKCAAEFDLWEAIPARQTP
ncbi:sulfotransferase family 2 domain-containing protein [Oceanicola sp. S124]|uniref:sulfotransferase family 2 domain-containing protein n=1 Tax=Oceanicola sp. S124 TaxID=1042378 RepID=UPI0002558974|nr:sulfotransferase family 2 domain-containing protein [Oceanicola sp. S124]